jgi:heterodisulfide reductase subunit A
LVNEKAVIDPYICVECGACVPICPRGAIDFKNATEKQIFAQLRGLLADKEPDETRIIAFVEKSIAYAGADLLGLDRTKYTTASRIIMVPSTAILSPKHLLYAFAMGADGIAILEGRHEIDEKISNKLLEKFSPILEDHGIESLRIWYSLVEIPAYKKIAGILDELAFTVEDLGPIPDEVRKDIKQKMVNEDDTLA